jgi:broad specificity phosphatase PhoE
LRLILIRHGESEGNAAGVLQGRMDFPLSEHGRLQAERTAIRLAQSGVTRVISSPLVRAATTAELIAAGVGVSVELDERLAEYDIGEASGLTGAELRERFPQLLQARGAGVRLEFPGEEGRDAFHARLYSALDSFKQLSGTTVAVAHGGVISALCHIVVGLDLNRPGAFQVANCSLTELVTDRFERLVLARHNDACHLEGAVTTADRG